MSDAPSEIRQPRFYHSVRVVGSLSVIAFIGHLAILAGSAALGIIPLMWFNVASCVGYLAAFFVLRRGYVTAVFLFGVVEVTAHAWYATWLVGSASGFQIYALLLIPLVIFYDKWSMRRRIIGSVFCLGSYAALSYSGQVIVGSGTAEYLPLIHTGNSVLSAGVLAMLALYYSGAVSRAEGQLINQNKELEALTRTDPLTKLPNRRFSEEWLALESARSKRGKKVFCICLADLDNFKVVNDNYGHDAGDAILREVSQSITSILRQQDVVARWGGEEFLIILPETDIENRSYTWAEQSISITITIGVAEHRLEVSVDDTIKKADEALYTGKHNGRNCVVAAS